MSEADAKSAKHGDPGCTCTTCHVTKRRSHKKSRNGCKTCKRRRIKCDEAKPQCGQCSKAIIICDFAASASFTDLVPTHDINVENVSHENSRRRGRPRKAWDTASKGLSPQELFESPDSLISRSTDTALVVTQSGEQQGQVASDPPWIWTVDDLELQHHFLTSDDLTHSNSRLWREKVPRLAFTHHYVLHLLLAVSALHLSKEKQDSTELSRYEQLADTHYAIGLRQVMAIMPTSNKDYAGALYISTTLVCAYAFAKKPSPEHLLIVSEGEEVAWFELLRGVRIVVTTMGWDAIYAGVLGPLPAADDETSLPKRGPTTRPVQWEPALSSLADLIRSSGDAETSVYLELVQRVSSCFETTFGTTARPRLDCNGKMEVIIGCIYRIDDDFVLCLKHKRPFALLVLAHFVVLLKSLEWMWYIKGWASHILHGIALILGPQFRQHLRWPREEIERLGKDRDHLTKGETV